ncbi:Uncharacterized protein APZ42_010331 [Daphnia magna]|uniref:Uncharacterized protein n=1 Tax=Daphnia magna TaxID=35525 RepID=A0A164DFU6_9CRUS|nr:Uncharacterized protein APZ42_010331 [Daphnia magna]
MDCPIIQIPVVLHGRQRNIKRALAKRIVVRNSSVRKRRRRKTQRPW